jgi:hypothetical protein
LLANDWDLNDHITTEVSHITAVNSSTSTRPRTYLPPTLFLANRKPATNLSNMLLVGKACLALSKGLKYTVTLKVIPAEDMLSGAELENAVQEVCMENC